MTAVEPLASPNPATTDWVPIGPAGGALPAPVVNGQWVKGVGGAAVWQPIGVTDLPVSYAVRIAAGVNITIPNAANTAISWPSNLVYANQQGMWNSSQPTRFTVKAAGIYHIDVAVRWSPNTVGGRDLIVRQNGSGMNDHIHGAAPSVSDSFDQRLSFFNYYALNDYVEVVVQQNMGAGLDLWQEPPAVPAFSMILVGGSY